MKKILFIDTWTQADRFISPVIKSFNKDKNICCLLHFDSMFLNSRYSNLESINSFEYENFDLKDFNYSFDKALSQINPDLVIFITVHGIVQRWANFVLKQKEIPCYFYMHGIREDNPAVIKSSLLYKIKRLFFYTNVYKYIAKEFLKINGLKIKNIFFMLNYYKELIFFNHSFTNNPTVNLGFDYNVMFLNHSKDEKYFRKNYPINSNVEFIVSGNISSVVPAIKSQELKLEKNCLLFISQTEIYSNNNLTKLLKKLQEIASHLGLELIFRPHPRDVENIGIARELNISISKYSEIHDLARTKVAAGLNSALMLGYMSLNTHIIQIIDLVNLSLCNSLNYDNYSELNINDLNDYKKNDIKIKNDYRPILINPVETIKNKIYYDFS